MKRASTGEAPHPGINASKMPVGGDVAGLIIVVSIVAIALIGLPSSRWFLGASLAFGVVMAVVRRGLGRARG